MFPVTIQGLDSAIAALRRPLGAAGRGAAGSRAEGGVTLGGGAPPHP